MRNNKFLVITLTLLLAIGTYALAQPPRGGPPPGRGAGMGPGEPGHHGPPPPGMGGMHGMGLRQQFENMDREEMRELIEKIRIAKLSQELELSDEQTVKLMRKFRETKERMEVFHKERKKLMENLRKAVHANNAAKADKILDLLNQQEADGMKLKRNSFIETAEGLSQIQKAKLYLFMNEFERHMRTFIDRAKQQYRRRGQAWDTEPGEKMSPEHRRQIQENKREMRRREKKADPITNAEEKKAIQRIP